MTCKECRKLIIKYVYDEANARDKKKLEEHIDNCEYCWSELFKCEQLMELVSGLPELQLSPFFENTLRTKLAQAKAHIKTQKRFRLKKLAFAGAIGFIFMLIFGLYFYRENYGKDSLQALTTIESELIKYNSSEGENINFIMPSVRFYENLETNNYNEGKIIY